MTTMTMKRGGIGGSMHSLLLALAFAAVVMLLMASAAFAGTDDTFNPILDPMTEFLTGSGGKIMALVSFAIGMTNLARGQFSLATVGIPLGVGVGVGVGTPLVTGLATALI